MPELRGVGADRYIWYSHRTEGKGLARMEFLDGMEARLVKNDKGRWSAIIEWQGNHHISRWFITRVNAIKWARDKHSQLTRSDSMLNHSPGDTQ